MSTMVFDKGPRGFFTMMGVTPERAVKELKEAGADIVGANCGNGIDVMIELAREIRSDDDGPVLVHSNAGIPTIKNGEIVYPETPEYMAERFKVLADIGVNILGRLLRNRPGTIFGRCTTCCVAQWPDDALIPSSRRGRLGWGAVLTQITTRGGGQASAVLERLGRCLELVPTDPHFNNISVGLYVKDDVCTVWTFSGKEGAAERMGEIRDQLVALGNMEAIEGAHDQAQFPCGYLHVRPVRFLLAQAVGKSPELRARGGRDVYQGHQEQPDADGLRSRKTGQVGL